MANDHWIVDTTTKNLHDHDFLFITRSVNICNPTFARLSGSSCSTSLALSAYACANARVRWTPDERKT